MAGNGESYDQITCTSCQEDFNTLSDLYAHASSAHGVEVE